MRNCIPSHSNAVTIFFRVAKAISDLMVGCSPRRADMTPGILDGVYYAGWSRRDVPRGRGSGWGWPQRSRESWRERITLASCYDYNYIKRVTSSTLLKGTEGKRAEMVHFQLILIIDIIHSLLSCRLTCPLQATLYGHGTWSMYILGSCGLAINSAMANETMGPPTEGIRNLGSVKLPISVKPCCTHDGTQAPTSLRFPLIWSMAFRVALR